MINKIKKYIFSILLIFCLSFLYSNSYRDASWLKTSSLPNPKNVDIDVFTSIYEYHDFCELLKDGCHFYAKKIPMIFENIKINNEIVSFEIQARTVIDELEKYATEERLYTTKEQFAYTTSILKQIYTRLYAFRLLDDADILLSITLPSSEIFKK